MKTYWLILILGGFSPVLCAQGDSPAAVKVERAPTLITSDSMEFQYESRTVAYSGNVKVADPQMQITCEQLTARFFTNSAKLEIENIIAERNVVLDAVDWEGRTNHATAAKLVYSYSVVNSVTNQTLELTGSPRLSNPLGGLAGDIIFVDLVKGKVFARNQTTSIQSEALKSAAKELESRTQKQESTPPPEPPK